MAPIETVRKPFDRLSEKGPFDIIGDVHGCYDELVLLLAQLGYRVFENSQKVVPPPGRKLIFIGDMVDRGPKIRQTLNFIIPLVRKGYASAVMGNHEHKLLRALKGANVRINHGLEHSMEQLKGISDELKDRIIAFLESLPTHYILDEGRLVTAHGGITEELQGVESKKTARFTLFGMTTGEIDSMGYPVRLDWASHYRGKGLVVYGHVPVKEPRWLNNTVDIDTGCVFGGKLTALRYPEMETLSVMANRAYYIR